MVQIYRLVILIFTLLILSCRTTDDGGQNAIGPEEKDRSDGHENPVTLVRKSGDKKKKGKIRICHFPANNKPKIIEISRNALEAHLKHGDGIAPPYANDNQDCLLDTDFDGIADPFDKFPFHAHPEGLNEIPENFTELKDVGNGIRIHAPIGVDVDGILPVVTTEGDSIIVRFDGQFETEPGTNLSSLMKTVPALAKSSNVAALGPFLLEIDNSIAKSNPSTLLAQISTSGFQIPIQTSGGIGVVLPNPQSVIVAPPIKLNPTPTSISATISLARLVPIPNVCERTSDDGVTSYITSNILAEIEQALENALSLRLVQFNIIQGQGQNQYSLDLEIGGQVGIIEDNRASIKSDIISSTNAALGAVSNSFLSDVIDFAFLVDKALAGTISQSEIVRFMQISVKLPKAIINTIMSGCSISSVSLTNSSSPSISALFLNVTDPSTASIQEIDGGRYSVMGESPGMNKIQGIELVLELKLEFGFTLSGLCNPNVCDPIKMSFKFKTKPNSFFRDVYEELPVNVHCPQDKPNWDINLKKCVPNKHKLSVSLAGILEGKVTSNPRGTNNGIDCVPSGGICSDDFDRNATVSLSAQPNTGTGLEVEWSGHCSGTNPNFTLPMDSDKSCTATFQCPADKPNWNQQTMQCENTCPLSSARDIERKIQTLSDGRCMDNLVLGGIKIGNEDYFVCINYLNTKEPKFSGRSRLIMQIGKSTVINNLSPFNELRCNSNENFSMIGQGNVELRPNTISFLSNLKTFVASWDPGESNIIINLKSFGCNRTYSLGCVP